MRVFTKEWKEKISKSKTGVKRKPFSEEWKIKLSQSAKKRFSEGRNKNLLTDSPKGELNPNWRGDNIGKGYVHVWLKKNFVKLNICEFCNKSCKTDWANISGMYKRDRNDFKELCRSCHSKYDNKIQNIYKYKRL